MGGHHNAFGKLAAQRNARTALAAIERVQERKRLSKLEGYTPPRRRAENLADLRVAKAAMHEALDAELASERTSGLGPAASIADKRRVVEDAAAELIRRARKGG